MPGALGLLKMAKEPALRELLGRELYRSGNGTLPKDLEALLGREAHYTSRLTDEDWLKLLHSLEQYGGDSPFTRTSPEVQLPLPKMAHGGYFTPYRG